MNWNLALADDKSECPLEYPLEEPSRIPEFREGIIDPILPDGDGMIAASRKPGLGSAIDARQLREYGTRFFKLSETGLKLGAIREKGIRAAHAIEKRKEANR